jgi:hypothetical protein
VRLSSGLPRIVEALKAAYPHLVCKNPESLQDALSIVREELTGRNLALAVTLDDLRLALLAKEVNINTTLPSGNLCAVRVANGTFIRPTRDGTEPEDKTDVPFIPLVPLLPLFLWAHSEPKVKDHKGTVRVYQTLFRLYLRGQPMFYPSGGGRFLWNRI